MLKFILISIVIVLAGMAGIAPVMKFFRHKTEDVDGLKVIDPNMSVLPSLIGCYIMLPYGAYLFFIHEISESADNWSLCPYLSLFGIVLLYLIFGIGWGMHLREQNIKTLSGRLGCSIRDVKKKKLLRSFLEQAEEDKRQKEITAMRKRIVDIEKMKEIMQKKGVSAGKLAELSGINESVVSRILNGQTLNPGIWAVASISKALETDINQFICMENINHSVPQNTEFQ